MPFAPWLRFFSETVQSWRPRPVAFVDRQMVWGVKLLELEKHRQRGGVEDDDSDSTYVLDFVDLVLRTLHDGEVLEDKFLIKQAVPSLSNTIP